MFPVASIAMDGEDDRAELFVIRDGNTWRVEARYESTGALYRPDLFSELESEDAAIMAIEDSYSGGHWDLAWLR